MTFLARLFPPLVWLPRYTRSDLQGDVAAGITVGVILIPQGMAYALIAGLPPIYGLYAALVPLFAYALSGTSRQLAVGPVAMVSLLVAAGVAPLADAQPDRYIALAVLLALLVGAIQLILGLARFGFLVAFLSHPVLSGFTSAAALIIGLTQLKHLLGIPLPGSASSVEILLGAAQRLADTHVLTLTLGIAGIAALVLLKRWKKTFPGPIVVVVLGTLVTWTAGLDQRGVEIVGEVPGGLPAPYLPTIDLESLRALLPTALAISLVGFMESIAVARSFASRHRYEIDANQELVALGLANMAGAFFRSFPVTGGFSRTAVNAGAGARSTIASMISAVVIGLTLLFLTPLFHYLPQAVLAAIVITAVAGLIDIREARLLWRVKKQDFFLFLLTFAATLTLGIEEGILAGVVASLILVIHESSRPHTAVMGQLPGRNTFRNVERHPEALTQSGIVVFRMDASLYFANAGYLKDRVQEIMDRDESLRVVVLDAYPINRLDSSAAHALGEIIESLNARGVRLLFAGVKGPVMDVLERAGIAGLLGPQSFFLEVRHAVEYAGRLIDPQPVHPEYATPA